MTYTNFGYCGLAAIGIGIQGFWDSIQTVYLREEIGLPYPDDGNGRIGTKLSDGDWRRFASYKTVQNLSMDYLPVTTICLLIGGIHYPLISSAFGAIYITGRHIFSSGYRKSGPEGRYTGNAILKAGLVGLFMASTLSCLKMLDVVDLQGY